MNLSKFKISIGDSIHLLKKVGLFKGKGLKEIGNHSDAFKKICRNNRHTDIFTVAIDNKDYEILLSDDSLFQFSFDKGTLRYAFIQNPILFISKENYLNSLYTPEDLLQLSDKEIGELIDSILDEEYEQFLNEQDLNLKAHIIRYDLNISGYSPLVHSYSHIHIGLNENLRIPCSKILTPLKFVLFVVKNTYYKEWKSAIYKEPELINILDTSKSDCEPLPGVFWGNADKAELYLH